MEMFWCGLVCESVSAIQLIPWCHRRLINCVMENSLLPTNRRATGRSKDEEPVQEIEVRRSRDSKDEPRTAIVVTGDSLLPPTFCCAALFCTGT
jgi:hypothetical protein